MFVSFLICSSLAWVYVFRVLSSYLKMKPPHFKGRGKHFNLWTFFETDFITSREGGFRPLYLVQLPFVYPEIVVTWNIGLVLEIVVGESYSLFFLTRKTRENSVPLEFRTENIMQRKSLTFQLLFCFLRWVYLLGSSHGRCNQFADNFIINIIFWWK